MFETREGYFSFWGQISKLQTLLLTKSFKSWAMGWRCTAGKASKSCRTLGCKKVDYVRQRCGDEMEIQNWIQLVSPETKNLPAYKSGTTRAKSLDAPRDVWASGMTHDAHALLPSSWSCSEIQVVPEHLAGNAKEGAVLAANHSVGSVTKVKALLWLLPNPLHSENHHDPSCHPSSALHQPGSWISLLNLLWPEHLSRSLLPNPQPPAQGSRSHELPCHLVHPLWSWSWTLGPWLQEHLQRFELYPIYGI